MSAFHRRAAIKGALADAVPPVVSGCAISPAAAAIRKAAPYVPAAVPQPGGAGNSPDAKLLDLCAQFLRLDQASTEAFDRYCAMPAGSPEAKALGFEIDARYEAWAAAGDACYTTPPRTPAGAAALIDVILARDSDHIEEAVQKPLRLLRDSLRAMVPA